MPTYPYACTACGHRFEVVQSFSDAPLTQCPVCEGRLRKVFSSVGIVFKGPGFYRTDSRAGNGKSNGSAPAKESTPSGTNGNATGKVNGAASNGTGTKSSTTGDGAKASSKTPTT